MEIISHANVLPWQIDADFVVQVIQQAGLAVVVLVLAGSGYAVLHRLLCNRTYPHQHSDTARGMGWPLGSRTVLQEGMGDEA